MERKKKEAREYHVSTTDSPSWDVVEKKRESPEKEKESRQAGQEQPGEESERRQGTPSEEDVNRRVEPGPGVSFPDQRR